MNRRKFITSTALALPSVAVFGAISTQPKTYRSVTSLYSNEDMTDWCNKNDLYYAKDDELNKKFFKKQYNKRLTFNDSNLFSRDVLPLNIKRTPSDIFATSLITRPKGISAAFAADKLFHTKYVIKDIYKSNNQKCIVVDCVFGEEYNK